VTWGSTVKEVSISNFFQEVPAILKRFWTTYIYSFANLIGIIIMATPLIPPGYRITQMTAILPSAVQAGCHILVRRLTDPIQQRLISVLTVALFASPTVPHRPQPVAHDVQLLSPTPSRLPFRLGVLLSPSLLSPHPPPLPIPHRSPFYILLCPNVCPNQLLRAVDEGCGRRATTVTRERLLPADAN
jgi:hypothetical protein